MVKCVYTHAYISIYIFALHVNVSHETLVTQREDAEEEERKEERKGKANADKNKLMLGHW